MMVAKNDEAKRSRIWRITVRVSSVLIILIAIYLLMKMFTTNPLEGSWESEDGSFVMDVGANGLMSVKVYDISEGVDVSVKMNYTLDKDAKTITIKEDVSELDKAVKKSDGTYTRDTLESALAGIVTTFDYSVEREELTLTEREYGEQLTFIRK